MIVKSDIIENSMLLLNYSNYFMLMALASAINKLN